MGSPNFNATAVGQNPFLNQWLNNRIDGKAMRALKVEREAAVMAVKATGQAQPATVVNFNPVTLRMDGGITFSVPSVISDAVPDKEFLHFTYKNVKHKATLVTIKEPYPFAKIKDVKKEDDVEVGVYDIKICKQIEIVHSFRTAYTFGGPNSSGMGGVLIFQGDRKALTRKDDNGRVVIKVPTYVELPNRTREYFCEDKYLDEQLATCLDLQKKYCQLQTQQAQTFWDQEDQRGNITDVHKIWHQFELDMGWRTTPAPWITLTHENAETCEGCGEPKKRATAYFCHKCTRPYDPLKSYLAGELGIDHPAMNRLKAEDWPTVREEEKRRKALREG